MKNKVFGEMFFDYGWKTKKEIILFNTKYTTIIHVHAYYEQDGITEQQEIAYLDYCKDEEKILKEAERLIKKYSDDVEGRFIPVALFIDRDGSYALLCDDSDEPDEGIAVCLSPDSKIMLQSDFL